MNDLRELARQFHEDHRFLSDPVEADGRCLWSVLMFACYAAGHGISVHLVRWSIRNDKYSDHWAIRLNHAQVIDFTRAQVDGKNGYIFYVEDYPCNYRYRRVYPAELFLEFFSPEENSQADSQMCAVMLRKFASSRMRYDARSQSGSSNVVGWFIALIYLALIFLNIHWW